ncbi:MAG: serine/threonine-protein kinase [Myxococcota bacterium]
MRDTRPGRPAHDRTERSPGETPSPESYEALEGQSLGRYVLGQQLGAGAMGIVYSATDPELDRRVAIKLLRPQGGREHDAKSLLEEARAMARLSHPNVITVHDVGAVGGRVFLAMEEVDGETLTSWLSVPRTTGQLLDTLIAAGRGLAAAHDRGLVHRDFKPDNVMVGSDGRVLVTDFGVAIDDSEARAEIASGTAPSDAVDELSYQGALVGTPAYMAPEQFLGTPADTRSDQFSFCVSAYEALYGHRPYQGSTAGAVFLAMANDEISPPGDDRSVPAWLHRAVVRGLSKAPDDRFASMHELLAELSRGRRPRRWATGVAAIGLCGAALVAFRGNEAQTEVCHAGAQHLAGVWDEAQASALTAALTAEESATGRETLERVTMRLDRYAEAWAKMRDESCRATLRGEQSQSDGDLRNACLDRRLHSVAQVVSVLREADPGVVRNAVATVAGLVPLAACADLDSLRSKRLPPERPADVARAREGIDRVGALVTAGRFDTALRVADELQAAADDLDYPPLTIEVALARGRTLAEAGRTEEAVEVLSAAYFGALQEHHDFVAAGAASELAYVVGYRQAQHGEGMQWGEHALAAASRLEEGGLAEAEARHSLAAIAAAIGDSETAGKHNERAYALRLEQLDPDHPLLARSLNALGNVHFGRAEYDEALIDYRAALELRQRVFGPSHPEVAGALNNVAIVLSRQGEFDAAIDALRRAVAIDASALGELHPDVAQATNNLGRALRRSGDPVAAIAEHQRSLEIREASQGRDHPDVGDALVGLGRAYSDLGRHDEAKAAHTRALALYERGFGPDHGAVGSALLGLGIAELGLAHTDAAISALERAAAIYAKTPRATEAGEVDALLRKVGVR